MPKIAGVNLLAILLATIVMFFLGFLWYGILFSGAWMNAYGYTEADFAGESPAWMGVGFLIELVLAFGIGWLIRARGLSGMGSKVGFALALALVIGAPLLGYVLAYQPAHSITAYVIDVSHILVTFAAAGAIHALFD